MQERSFIRHEQNRASGIISPTLQKTLQIVDLQKKFHYPRPRNTKSMNITSASPLGPQLAGLPQSRGLRFTSSDFYNTLGGANYNGNNTNPNLNQSSTCRKPILDISKTARENFHTRDVGVAIDKNGRPNGCGEIDKTNLFMTRTHASESNLYRGNGQKNLNLV
jgi:hypothetical protein